MFRWQLYIRYDPEYIRVSGCLKGSGWGSGSFSSNEGTIEGQVQLVGYLGNGLGNRQLLVSRCELRVISSAAVVVRIEIEVNEISVRTSTRTDLRPSTPAIAGTVTSMILPSTIIN